MSVKVRVSFSAELDMQFLAQCREKWPSITGGDDPTQWTLSQLMSVLTHDDADRPDIFRPLANVSGLEIRT